MKSAVQHAMPRHKKYKNRCCFLKQNDKRNKVSFPQIIMVIHKKWLLIEIVYNTPQQRRRRLHQNIISYRERNYPSQGVSPENQILNYMNLDLVSFLKRVLFEKSNKFYSRGQFVNGWEKKNVENFKVYLHHYVTKITDRIELSSLIEFTSNKLNRPQTNKILTQWNDLTPRVIHQWNFIIYFSVTTLHPTLYTFMFIMRFYDWLIDCCGNIKKNLTICIGTVNFSAQIQTHSIIIKS